MKIFRAFVRELGTSSPTARAHALSYAMQLMASQRLTLAAAEAGLATDRGADLLERAARAQGRAERSAVAAMTFAGLLDGKRAPATSDLAALVAAAAKPREPQS